MRQTKIKEIRLAADLQTDSIVDGPGLRAVIWTQGCGHHCKGCQNPQTWDFNGGGLVPIEEVLKALDETEYQTGLTFSGGDPMYQPEACNEIAKYAKKKGMNVWVYTGYTWEEVLELGKKNKAYMDFLKNTDVLVDGRFVLKELDLSILFRGSRNQRLIDVPKSLKKGEVVLFDESAYKEENKFKQQDNLYI